MSTNTSLVEQSAREHPGVAAPLAPQPDQVAYTHHSFPNHQQPAPKVPEINGASPVPAAHTLPHGYSHPPLPQSQSDIHPELRSKHEPIAPAPAYAPIPNMIQAGMPPPDQTVAMSGPPAPGAPVEGPAQTGEVAPDGKKKRELSQSKRAAQNRAAQRAFRQRKEGYIKKLEQQVRDFGEMEVTFKAIQNENYLLRDYVVALQSRLLAIQGDYPPPPPGLTLAVPNPQGQPNPADVPQPAAPPGTAPPQNPLEVAAQAVAGLNRSEHLAGREHHYPAPAATAPHRHDNDDARTAEQVARLQTDGGADGLPAAQM
ncbi:hypothetical protein VTI74DRAFT_9350 [Chaetomium olivicolor]